MLRLGFGVYVTPSVVLAVFPRWFRAGFYISKHVLSFSFVVLVFQSWLLTIALSMRMRTPTPPDISSGNLP